MLVNGYVSSFRTRIDFWIQYSHIWPSKLVLNEGINLKNNGKFKFSHFFMIIIVLFHLLLYLFYMFYF